jgi:hypothetical protein
MRHAGETDAADALRCEEYAKRADRRRDDWATKRQPENEAHTAAPPVDERLLAVNQYQSLFSSPKLQADAAGHATVPVAVATAIRHTTSAPSKTVCSMECSSAANFVHRLRGF